MSEAALVSLSQLIESANSVGVETLTPLCDIVLSFLVSPSAASFQSDLQNLASENSINVSTIKGAAHSLIILYQEAMQNGYSSKRFEERCLDAGMNEETTTIVCQLWKKRSLQVATSLLSKSMSTNSLVDMDWTFGVTAASDDCNHIGKTYLQLKLTIETGGGGGSSNSTANATSSASAAVNGSASTGSTSSSRNLHTVFIELSLDQFYQLLASMEKCKAYLDYICPLPTSGTGTGAGTGSAT